MKTRKLDIMNVPPPSLAPLPAEVDAFIAEVMKRPHPESYLIEVLHRLQEAVGYLKPEHLDAVAWKMQIPAAQVSGVATFYHLFSFTPKGKHRISVCLGTACFVKGAARVLERLCEILGIEEDGVTPDGEFSIHTARCVGACALAPVLIVDDKVYGNVKPQDVINILAEHGFKPAPAAKSASKSDREAKEANEP